MNTTILTHMTAKHQWQNIDKRQRLSTGNISFRLELPNVEIRQFIQHQYLPVAMNILQAFRACG